MKCLAVLAACAALASCAPPPAACLLPGQKPMLMIDLFFGRDIEGRGPVTDAEWADFTRTDITPRFPDGFSVFDAHGQWLNPQTNRIGAEASKMVRIEAMQAPGTAAKIAAVANAYRTQFHQSAVGISTAPVCAAF
jgi:hypothetical protein